MMSLIPLPTLADVRAVVLPVYTQGKRTERLAALEGQMDAVFVTYVMNRVSLLGSTLWTTSLQGGPSAASGVSSSRFNDCSCRVNT